MPHGNYSEWLLLEHKMDPKKHQWQEWGLGESVGADSSIKLWVMIHFICIRCPRGTDTTRHLQPKQNASKRAHNFKREVQWSWMWVKDFSRCLCYPVLQACIRGTVQSICRLTAVSLSCLFEWDWGLLLGIIYCNLKHLSQCTFQVGTLVYTLYCTEKTFFFILIQINFNKKKKRRKNQHVTYFISFLWSQCVVSLVLADWLDMTLVARFLSNMLVCF